MTNLCQMHDDAGSAQQDFVLTSSFLVSAVRHSGNASAYLGIDHAHGLFASPGLTTGYGSEMTSCPILLGYHHELQASSPLQTMQAKWVAGKLPQKHLHKRDSMAWLRDVCAAVHTCSSTARRSI